MAANINVDGINYLGPTKDMVQLGSDRSTLGPMVEAILKERGRTLGGTCIPSAAISSAPITSRSPRLACRRFRSASRRSSPARTPRTLMKKQEDYNGKDYHQPSDQYDPSWDFSGGVDDMRVLAQLAGGSPPQPEMPKYNDGDQFAQAGRRVECRRQKRCNDGRLVTLDEIQAARERIKPAARVTPLIEVPFPAFAKAPRAPSPQSRSLALSEGRKPSADGRVQDSRRVQHDRAAAEGRS